MKVIPQTRHSHYISIFVSISVPDEGYSKNMSSLFLFY